MAKLKYKHIKNGRWYYDRSKTGVSPKIGKPLLKEALEIIEEFGTGGSGDDYVFDILVGYDKEEKTIADRVLRYATYIRNESFYLCKKNGLGWLLYLLFCKI